MQEMLLRSAVNAVGAGPHVRCERNEESMTVQPTAIVAGANSGIDLETTRGGRDPDAASAPWFATEELLVSIPPRSHSGPA